MRRHLPIIGCPESRKTEDTAPRGGIPTEMAARVSAMKKQSTVNGKRTARRMYLPLGLLFLLLAVTVLPGCAKKIPHQLIPEYGTRNVRLIAVLPVVDKAQNPEVNALLRQRIVEGLYFKGYPKIPANVIDDKLTAFFKNVREATLEALPPRDAGAVLGVDAVLYVTLEACRTSFLYLYAPTSVEVSFRLHSARTGELLWGTGHKVSERNFDITPGRLRMKSCQVFEPALDEIVKKALETLPDGPEL